MECLLFNYYFNSNRILLVQCDLDCYHFLFPGFDVGTNPRNVDLVAMHA